MDKYKLLQSLLTVLLCFSLIAGSTYSIFTDQVEVAMEVSNGKVEVRAGIVPSSVITFSATPNQGSSGYVSVVNDTAGVFANGGRITIMGNGTSVAVDNMQAAESTIRDTDMASSMNARGPAQPNPLNGINLCRVIMQGLKDAMELLDLMDAKWASNQDSTEINDLAAGFDFIANVTKYNGKYLLDGQELVLLTNQQEGETLTVKQLDMRSDIFNGFSESTDEKLAAVRSVLEGSVSDINGIINELIAIYESGGEEYSDPGEVSTSMYSTANIVRMTPGDTAEFIIKVVNYSDVNIRYRLVWSLVGDLADALEIKVVNAEGDDVSPFESLPVSVTTWNPMNGSDEDTVIDNLFVSVKMREDADNEFADVNGDIKFTLEAVQGNTADFIDTQAFAVLSKDGEENVISFYNRNDVQALLNEKYPEGNVKVYPVVHGWNGMKQSEGQALYIKRKITSNLNQGIQALGLEDASELSSQNIHKINVLRSSTDAPWINESIDKVVFADTLPIWNTESWFFSQKNLKEVVFEAGVDFKICSYGMFKGCTSLETITLPDSLRIIEGFAFEDCTSLKTVNLGAYLEEIGIEAFKNCTVLESITFPDSLKMIGDNAFSGCDSLVSAGFSNTSEGWKALNTIVMLPGACKNGTYLSLLLDEYTVMDIPNLSDSAQNATYLKETYLSNGWCSAEYFEEQKILIEKYQSNQGVLDLIQ